MDEHTSRITSFTLTINTQNAAFTDEPQIEVARILAQLAIFVADAPPHKGIASLFDISGNVVGSATWEPR